MHSYVIRRALLPCGYTLFRLIGTHLALVRFSVSPINHAIVSSAIPQACQAGNYCCLLFLIYWTLSFIFLKNIVCTRQQFILTRGHMHNIAHWYTSRGPGLLVCRSVTKIVSDRTYYLSSMQHDQGVLLTQQESVSLWNCWQSTKSTIFVSCSTSSQFSNHA